MTKEEIEALAAKHESCGFGRVGKAGWTTYGFTPDGLISFVRAIVSAERERLAQLAETRADGWHSLTPAEIRAGRVDA